MASARPARPGNRTVQRRFLLDEVEADIAAAKAPLEDSA
jgi:hypothetical protein